MLLYRQCLNPQARVVLAGYEAPETQALRPSVEALGIDIVCWSDRPRIAEQQHEGPHEPLVLLDRPPRVLRWNVAALASSRGLDRVPALSRALDIPRQGLYSIVRDEAAQVSLDVLARLARVLDAHPGDWFTWTDGPHGRMLVWNVAAKAQERGLAVKALSFRAETYMGSVSPIWIGEAKAVAVATLAKIAHALDTAEQPFAVGELFAWDRPAEGQPDARGFRVRRRT